MPIAVRELRPRHVGEDGLALRPGFVEVGELVPELVAMQAAVVADVELMSNSRLTGQGATAPQSSHALEPRR